MKFIKKVFIKFKRLLKKSKQPIGLSSIGIRLNYLNKINKFNYSMNRFCFDINYPVKKPFYLKN